jgi:hypothetical protein
MRNAIVCAGRVSYKKPAVDTAGFVLSKVDAKP